MTPVRSGSAWVRETTPGFARAALNRSGSEAAGNVRLVIEHCKNHRRREVRARLEQLKAPGVLPKRASLRLRVGRKDHDAADSLPECRAR